MFEDIYEQFQIEVDGEQFDSDDDALVAANKAMRAILKERDWKFLQTTTTFSAGDLSFLEIDNFDAIIRIWYDSSELNKAEFDRRFDTEYDYWIDNFAKEVMLIGTFYEDKDLIVDYKYIPDEMTLTNDPLTIPLLNDVIALKMELTYFVKDQDMTTYTQMEDRLENAMNLLIDYNNSL